MSLTTNHPRGLNLPRPKPPIVPVSSENVRDWWALFVNRKATPANPPTRTRKRDAITTTNLRIRMTAGRRSWTATRCASTWPAG